MIRSPRTPGLISAFLLALLFTAAPGLALGADVKISELPAAAAADGTEVFPVVQGTDTEKMTTLQMRTYALAGNAATATALAANGANCSVGNYPLGVDASGAVESCTAIGAGTGDVVGPASAVDNGAVRFDTTTGKLVQDSALTISDIASTTVTVATAAGNSLALQATAPAAANGASQAGKSYSITASPAVASLDTAGAAAGGSVTITAGAAARLTSGNANGGNINLAPGAGIGTGVAGQVLIGDGTVGAPGIAFTTDPASGIYSNGAGVVRFSAAGGQRMTMNSAGVTMIGTLTGNAAGSAISGFKPLLSTTTSGTENGTNSYPAVQNNTGATGLNTRTLPISGIGEVYTYVVTDADGIRVAANTGDTIRLLDKITAGTGYVESTTIGSHVSVLGLSASEWIVVNVGGVWTDGTFTYDDTSLTTP